MFVKDLVARLQAEDPYATVFVSYPADVDDPDGFGESSDSTDTFSVETLKSRGPGEGRDKIVIRVA